MVSLQQKLIKFSWWHCKHFPDCYSKNVFYTRLTYYQPSVQIYLLKEKKTWFYNAFQGFLYLNYLIVIRIGFVFALALMHYVKQFGLITKNNTVFHKT